MARDLAIDRLRGVAILLVVAYHAGPLAWRLAPYGPTGLLEPPPLGAWWLAVPLLHFGFTGVHLFFVISGFCIHASARGGRDLFRTREGFPALPSSGKARRASPPPRASRASSFTQDARQGMDSDGGLRLDGEGLRRYALRRLVRIAPPYWIALALFGVVVPLVAAALHRAAPSGANGPAAASDLALHALFLHGLFPRTIFSIDPAFWSLATEMEFYVFYPVVAWAILRLGARRVLLGALLLSLGWRAAVLLRWAPTVENFMIYRVWLHGFFVPRWYEWILGCWLAEVAGSGALDQTSRFRHARAGGAVLLLLGALCRVHVAIDKLFADLLFSTGFALILGGALAAERGLPDPAPARRVVARIGQTLGRWVARALAAVGRRSYGVYLTHQPILDGEWLPVGPRLLLAAAAGALFSLGCERPFEHLARRVGRRVPPSDPQQRG